MDFASFQQKVGIELEELMVHPIPHIDVISETRVFQFEYFSSTKIY